MRQPLVQPPALIAAVVLATLGAVAVLAQSQSAIQLIAMDADPTGNTATSLGHLDPCVSVEPRNQVAVDLVVDAVPRDRPFLGFQVEIGYDPEILELTSVDNNFLLGASGAYEPFEGLSDPVPDSDGSYTIIAADLASVPPDENMESGPGVLSRVTFTAKSSGTSSVAPGFDPPDVYPVLVDSVNQTIEVQSIAGITIAVGQDCPPGQTEIEPTELPPLSSLEETPTSTPTPSPSPTVAPDPAPTASTVLPAAFPPTGGGGSGDDSGLHWTVAAIALAITAGGGWVWGTGRFRR